MPSKYEAAFQAAVIERERQICIDLLRQSPEMTLGEIHKLSKGALGKIFDAISVSELIRGVALSDEEEAAPVKAPSRGRKMEVAAAPAKAEAPAEAPAEKAKAPAAPGKVNTRTPAGRKAYDEAIFVALQAQGKPVGVAKLMARAGGSNLQARAALNRLINAGRVTWTGKARGTRYSVAK
ncbi:MAG: hypothetical protein R3A79_18380 [Nannocystaceae bacterium]